MESFSLDYFSNFGNAHSFLLQHQVHYQFIELDKNDILEFERSLGDEGLFVA